MKINWRTILVGELSWKRFFRSLIIIYVILFFIALFFSERFIFPYNDSSYTKSTHGVQLISSPDGEQIATRFWRSSKEKYLLLFFHGNQEDLGHLDVIANKLNKYGFSVLAIDYRGYGLSTGTPSEQSCYNDSMLLYDTAIHMGYSAKNIIIWGRSVGSGSAVNLALQKNVVALVLESPFVSAFRVVTKFPVLPFDRFNNLSKIDKVNEPLFIIHGSDDKVISSWHSDKLFIKHLGKKEKHIIQDAGHNDLWLHNIENILRKLELFVTAHG